ncbi:MAG: hypothetical protein IKV80_03795 [Bacteroidales bacterium]|nr:hypothetical protein [Bacteroidales bacterium]
MKTVIVASLRKGWHEDFDFFNEKGHKILDNVNNIYFYGAESVDEAKETLDAEGYYSYLPTNCDMESLKDFCELIRDLSISAIPLMVSDSDIECYTVITVTDSFYETLKSTDFEDLKVNDINTLVEFIDMIR